MKHSRDTLERDYTDNVGHEPVERYPEGHPERWQWEYRGTPIEKEQLLRDLGIEADRDENQEKLF